MTANLRFNRSWSSQHRLMMDSLKLRSSKLCEIGKSNRAATRRDRVLSSGISNRPSLRLAAPTPDELLESLALARSK
jgi:hypothetical protein